MLIHTWRVFRDAVGKSVSVRECVRVTGSRKTWCGNIPENSNASQSYRLPTHCTFLSNRPCSGVPVTLIHVSNPCHDFELCLKALSFNKTKKMRERPLFFSFLFSSPFFCLLLFGEQVTCNKWNSHIITWKGRFDLTGIHCAEITLNMRAEQPCPGDYPP